MLRRLLSVAVLSAVATMNAACASATSEEADVAVGELNAVVYARANGVNPDAVLFMRNGKVLFEEYSRGYDAKTKHLSGSMAKTIAGVLVAQEIDRGAISLTTPIGDVLPEVQSPARVVDALQMSSGIAFREEYSGVPFTSDATRMLYMEGPKSGLIPFLSMLPQKTDAKPGDHFYYSSGDSNLLMAVVQKTSASQEAYDAIAFERFFERLGIADATFEQDSKGVFVWGTPSRRRACMFAT